MLKKVLRATQMLGNIRVEKSASSGDSGMLSVMVFGGWGPVSFGSGRFWGR